MCVVADSLQLTKQRGSLGGRAFSEFVFVSDDIDSSTPDRLGADVLANMSGVDSHKVTATV